MPQPVNPLRSILKKSSAQSTKKETILKQKHQEVIVKPKIYMDKKKKQKDRKLSFMTSDSLEGIKKTEKHIRKMSFADRLKLEEEVNDGEEVEVRHTGCGQRQMSYTIKDKSTEKFQQLRKKQTAHQLERKSLIRSANKLNGHRKL